MTPAVDASFIALAVGGLRPEQGRGLRRCDRVALRRSGLLGRGSGISASRSGAAVHSGPSLPPWSPFAASTLGLCPSSRNGPPWLRPPPAELPLVSARPHPESRFGNWVGRSSCLHRAPDTSPELEALGLVSRIHFRFRFSPWPWPPPRPSSIALRLVGGDGVGARLLIFETR